MHQKKTNIKIGIDSDFIPTPPPHQIQIQENPNPNLYNESPPPTNFLSTPHKRPLVNTATLSHSPTSNSLLPRFSSHSNPSSSPTKTAFRILTRLRLHLRLLLLFSLPSFYFLFVNPHHSFFLAFLSAALLLSLNLAALPSLRRSFSLKLSSLSARRSAPVIWSIGSNPRFEKRANSGSWVQVYSNGDVYEGEFERGKCSGSGVYYYCMSGRYEGDWVDEKYNGYGVETWARGSRYRGQYRQRLRHGYGVYRFYTGDVYAGEWSNGHSHGSGVHTYEDGSRYVGEFKWGVKHGLGHYHFR